MKYVFFFFALLVAGISADTAEAVQPEVENVHMERFVDGIVNQIIANVTQTIIDEGLDPLAIKREARQWSLSVPEIFTAVAIMEDVLIVNLSDIRIINLSFSLITLRVEYYLCIPHVSASTSHSYVKCKGFGEEMHATLEGRVDIYDACAAGNIRVIIGQHEIGVRELVINIFVRSIKSQITKLDVHNYDLADSANTFMSTTIPDWLINYDVFISVLLKYYLWDIIEDALNQGY